MKIDFHTHAFPDELASKAISAVLADLKDPVVPASDGTVAGLIKNMDDWHVDVSVIQPVITKQAQFKKLNDWARDICSDRLICFGGIYPGGGDYKTEIDYLVSLGLKGLKLHPEYQNFIVDDVNMLRIYDYALDKGLILLIHAGYDPAFSSPCKSSPRQFANVAKAMKGGRIVAAHLGGFGQWDRVEQDLAGTDIYLDTSVGFEYFSDELFLRIAKIHGVDRILFASDSPWSNAKTEMERIQALPIPGEDISAILGGNALRLLGIQL